MAIQLEIGEILKGIKPLATAGYALAMHVRYTTPAFLFQTYSKDWLEYYSQNGLVMHDPTVAWGFTNAGMTTWSSLADQDTQGVFAKAAEHGLAYGTAYTIDSNGSRSLGSFARHDREFTAEENEKLMQYLDRLHALTANIKSVSPQLDLELRKMSVKLTHSL